MFRLTETRSKHTLPSDMARRRPKRAVSLTLVIEKRGNWYMGYVSEVPGVNAQERTIKATRRSVLLALEELSKLRPGQIHSRSRRTEQVTVEL